MDGTCKDVAKQRLGEFDCDAVKPVMDGEESGPGQY